jgi:hypothetical protein
LVLARALEVVDLAHRPTRHRSFFLYNAAPMEKRIVLVLLLSWLDCSLATASEAKQKKSRPKAAIQQSDPAQTSVEEDADPKSSPDEAKPLTAHVSKGKSRWMIERIGVSLDLASESSHMSGYQSINQFRSDESFDYSPTLLAGSVYVLSHPYEHFRFGPAVRFIGKYGGDRFTFGYLVDCLAIAEFSFHVVEQVEAIVGLRAGVSILFPGKDLSQEISRLRAQGAGVWNVPRVGGIGEVTVGARRKLLGSLYARLDANGQLGYQFVFSTDNVNNGLRFQKSWSNNIHRLGLTLALEVVF